MSLLDGNYALLTGGGFQVATLIPHVTIDAVGQDALGITGFPVETGATLADHSFKLPSRLEMTLGWSNSTEQTEGYIQSIYQQLLALQATRKPFTISTSRRRYPNMLMESLTDPISKETYNAMVPRITFRELQISRTQTSNSSTAQASSDPSNQANPANTGDVLDRGNVEAQGVGSQAFVGAFSPGNYSTTGSALGTPGFDTNGIVGVDASGISTMPIDSANLSGISPPMQITLPEISNAPTDTYADTHAVGPEYNIFSYGP